MPLFNSRNMLLLTDKHFKNGKIIHPEFQERIGMILIGADWCPYCVAASPIWKQFRQLSNDTFIIAAVDAVKYPGIAKQLKAPGFPSIYHVSKTGCCSQYKGDRDIVTLVKVMCKRESRNNVCIRNS